jgi:RNA recognition motif-containing protein
MCIVCVFSQFPPASLAVSPTFCVTGLPQYAFVEMMSDADADKAIQELNDSILRGRTLNVEYARPRPERPAA